MNESGGQICAVSLEPKLWILLYGFALKRQRDRPIVDIGAWDARGDTEMQEAFQRFDIRPEFGEEQYIREVISRINSGAERALGRKWNVIARVGRGKYSIAPKIR